MQEPDQSAEQIDQIHSIMTRSATFVSLSGLSGLSAGIVALVAVWFMYDVLGGLWLTSEKFALLRSSPELVRPVTHVFLSALIAALALAFFFTWRKAKRHQMGLLNLASRRFGMHLALPLLAGGLFVLVLAKYGTYELICPSMLVFFGLAIVNAGKYSFSETFVFGLIELALGLAAALWVEGGLFLWAVGFGVVTASYGVIMYLQYER